MLAGFTGGLQTWEHEDMGTAIPTGKGTSYLPLVYVPSVLMSPAAFPDAFRICRYLVKSREFGWIGSRLDMANE